MQPRHFQANSYGIIFAFQLSVAPSNAPELGLKRRGQGGSTTGIGIIACCLSWHWNNRVKGLHEKDGRAALQSPLKWRGSRGSMTDTLSPGVFDNVLVPPMLNSESLSTLARFQASYYLFDVVQLASHLQFSVLIQSVHIEFFIILISIIFIYISPLASY